MIFTNKSSFIKFIFQFIKVLNNTTKTTDVPYHTKMPRGGAMVAFLAVIMCSYGFCKLLLVTSEGCWQCGNSQKFLRQIHKILELLDASTEQLFIENK